MKIALTLVLILLTLKIISLASGAVITLGDFGGNSVTLTLNPTTGTDTHNLSFTYTYSTSFNILSGSSAYALCAPTADGNYTVGSAATAFIHHISCSFGPCNNGAAGLIGKFLNPSIISYTDDTTIDVTTLSPEAGVTHLALSNTSTTLTDPMTLSVDLPAIPKLDQAFASYHVCWTEMNSQSDIGTQGIGKTVANRMNVTFGSDPPTDSSPANIKSASFGFSLAFLGCWAIVSLI